MGIVQKTCVYFLNPCMFLLIPIMVIWLLPLWRSFENHHGFYYLNKHISVNYTLWCHDISHCGEHLKTIFAFADKMWLSCIFHCWFSFVHHSLYNFSSKVLHPVPLFFFRITIVVYWMAGMGFLMFVSSTFHLGIYFKTRLWLCKHKYAILTAFYNGLRCEQTENSYCKIKHTNSSDWI